MMSFSSRWDPDHIYNTGDFQTNARKKLKTEGTSFRATKQDEMVELADRYVKRETIAALSEDRFNDEYVGSLSAPQRRERATTLDEFGVTWSSP